MYIESTIKLVDKSKNIVCSAEVIKLTEEEKLEILKKNEDSTKHDGTRSISRD
jgi:hypothetical protein